MTFTPNQFDIQKGGYYGTDGEFGGRYVPEILLPALEELEEAFYKYSVDPEFLNELEDLLTNFVGRPSPLIFAKNLTEQMGGAKIYLKNEGSNLTGSHKINNCIYQVLLAKKMGKTEIICETGAGQHGVACAVVCAKFNLSLTVYMGQKDIEKQYPNVFFMKQMGAKIVPVTRGNQKLTDAADAAMSSWISSPSSYYMLGSAIGPHPYPEIIRAAQKVIGKEIKKQLNVLPDKIVACIGGGSNAIGAFNEFLYDPSVELIGVEAGGTNLKIEGEHSSRLHSGLAKSGILEGFKSVFLYDSEGKVMKVGGISAGLGYVGIGPLHAYLHQVGRLKVVSASDDEVLKAFKLLATKEGIIGALESCHALWVGLEEAKTMTKDQIVVVNLSGRGDNYLFNIASALKDTDFENFCNQFKI